MRDDDPTDEAADEATQLRPPPAAGGPARPPGGAAAPPAFHPYAVAHELGRGGMGAVYAAHDPALAREVAIKVLHPGQDAAGFVVEARVTARLHHPGVPPVHALGELADGRPFLAMKLIDGRTLAAELKAAARPADLARLLTVFERVCETVGFAHSRGVIHRDLKPSNVMVGDFGEVYVVDWGLAKPAAAAADPAAAGPPAAGPAAVGDPAAAAETVAGAVKGTPAYMAPEQARGEPVDARADVFALGGILAAVLTGRAPFGGTSVMDTIIQAAQAELAACFAGLDGCGADPALVALAKRCLAAAAADRPADGAAVAAAVAAHRAAAAERLRRAERERAAAEARAEEERNTRREAEAREREQRRRRRAQLALAAVVLAAVGGAGLAAHWVGEERAAAGRRARAAALVRALEAADTAAVPALVAELDAYRDAAGPALREMATRPAAEPAGLHARLALLPEEPGRAGELADWLLGARPEQLPPVVRLLGPHAAAVAPGLWAALGDAGGAAGRRVRAACALAALAPDDPRWAALAPAVAGLVAREDPLAAAAWAAPLDPVAAALLPPLLAEYAAAGPAARDVLAALLARYAAGRPAALAELAVALEPRHLPLAAAALAADRAAVAPLLRAELGRAPEGENDRRREAAGRRRGRAAAALIALGEADAAWPVFQFPADGDPTARSHLVERLPAAGADPRALAARLAAEPDPAARRALVLALGDVPPAPGWAAEREALAARLLALYRGEPDPGLPGAHADPGFRSAADWLLRRHWGRAAELNRADAALAAAARARAVGARLAGPAWAPHGPPAPAGGAGGWFVTGEGLAFAVVPAPAGPFAVGSPPDEPGRGAKHEAGRPGRVDRAFAVATREVTHDQFQRCVPAHRPDPLYSPGGDAPAVGVSWHRAAAYCNWLSAQEGIPAAQWCYEAFAQGDGYGMRPRAGHLGLTGYRLPTEDEWEYACRAGAVTARPYGRGVELLPRYGWSLQPDERARPVGGLRPNDLGLFDALGNALEWAGDPVRRPDPDAPPGLAASPAVAVPERASLRGGSFFFQPRHLRAANRQFYTPESAGQSYGFRPARTLPR